MRMLAPGLVLALCVNTSAQTALTRFASPKFDPQIEFVPFVGQDGRTVPSACGYWRVSGYGDIVQVTETEVTSFSETQEHTWRHARDRDRLEHF